MSWWIGAVVLVVILPAVLRRRREIVRIFPWEPISTLHGERSRKTTKERQAALDAATQLLQ
jgi:hypothetical protein